MIRILTDTGSDIPYLSAGDIGIEIVELDIRFDDMAYDYRNDADFSVFYKTLTQSKTLPTTSLVSPGQYLPIFEDVKEKGGEMLVVTISGGLSGTYQSAVSARDMCGYDGITVVDSRQCAVTQRMLVEHAVKMRDEGQSRDAMAKALEELRDRLSLLVLLDTLTFLRKGGRIPSTLAILGEVLNMKPVVTVRDGKVEPLKKVRGAKAGVRALWDQFEASTNDPDWPVYFGYTHDKAKGEEFMTATKDKYNLAQCGLFSVGGVIGTHAGPGAIAIGYMKKADHN